MSTREELLLDHQILRAKLDLLEQWLPHTHAAPFTLLHRIRTIARRLQQHTEREHAAIENLSSARHGQASVESFCTLTLNSEEERKLFPIIDRIAAEQSQERGLTHDAIGGQEDCRTVERCGEVSV